MEMKVLVTGSLAVTKEQMRAAIEQCPWAGFASTVIVPSSQPAAVAGEEWAIDNDLTLMRSKHSALDEVSNMLANADAMIFAWDGASRVSQALLRIAEGIGVRVYNYRTDTGEVVDHPGKAAYAARWEAAEERAAIMEIDGGVSRAEAERNASKAHANMGAI